MQPSHTHSADEATHTHVFLGERHEDNERKTWLVIGVTTLMMFLEIIGGSFLGSMALVADGWHMSTHAGALAISAFAYMYARRHKNDPDFAFGTGKLGDLAGFTSAIALAMISLLIVYQATQRLLYPVPIIFGEAIAVAALGLVINVVSAWLLHDGDHGHSHATDSGRPQNLSRAASDFKDPRHVFGTLLGGHYRNLEPGKGAPATHERHRHAHDHHHDQHDHGHQSDDHREEDLHKHDHNTNNRTAARTAGQPSPPHEGDAPKTLKVHHHDNNIRSAYIHVIADAAISVLAIVGLLLGWFYGWVWMDPIMGIIGATVIANWSYTLMRDTGRVLLDITPDKQLTDAIRKRLEANGDKVTDLHLWQVGPGHYGAIVSLIADDPQSPSVYKKTLEGLKALSHVTVEVHPCQETTLG